MISQEMQEAFVPDSGSLAEALGLTDDSDALFCVVCTNPIPEGRNRRQTATCSEKCKNRLDTIRAHQKASKRCPACLHPSTPEERAEFRAWRAQRGDIRSPEIIKRDTILPNKGKMKEAMQRAINALQSEADRITAELAPQEPQEELPPPGPENENQAYRKQSRARRGLSETQRAKLQNRLDRLTSVISQCERMITPKGEAA